MNESEKISEILKTLRLMRDNLHPMFDEIRSIYNSVCDRLYVLESKLDQLEIKDGENYGNVTNDRERI